jgi:hypothetical protein
LPVDNFDTAFQANPEVCIGRCLSRVQCTCSRALARGFIGIRLITGTRVDVDACHFQVFVGKQRLERLCSGADLYRVSGGNNDFHFLIPERP